MLTKSIIPANLFVNSKSCLSLVAITPYLKKCFRSYLFPTQTRRDFEKDYSRNRYISLELNTFYLLLFLDILTQIVYCIISVIEVSCQGFTDFVKLWRFHILLHHWRYNNNTIGLLSGKKSEKVIEAVLVTAYLLVHWSILWKHIILIPRIHSPTVQLV